MLHAVFAYDITEWLLFFYLYSFLGWVFESAYVSIKERHFVNRGFLRGPFLPLYGTGAILILFVSIPVEENAVLVYLAGCIAATALEYVTGVVMEALFKVRYWDYSNQKFNFRGLICLPTTLVWGVFTLLLVYVVHRPIEQAVLSLPDTFASVLSYVLTVLFTVDATLSVKAALEVRNTLVTMEDIREKLEVMQRRADVILAFAQEDLRERQDERKERHEVRASAVKGAVEKLEGTLEKLEQRRDELAPYREETDVLQKRLAALKERASQFTAGMSGYSRSLLRDNPSAVSRRFRDALEELKERAARDQESGDRESEDREGGN